MAVQSDSGGKDDVKTQFATREGTYRLMTLSEYSRPNRVGYTGGAGASHVRVSLVSLPPAAPVAAPAAAAAAPTASASTAPAVEPAPAERDSHAADDRICFNHGKELYVYVYRGVKKAADLTKPVDKKMYKGTSPTCHDFNSTSGAPDSVSLVIGFSTGQIQLIDPIKKELSKLFNEERLIDKTRVTCIKWVPGSSALFVAAHASGALYVYSAELAAPAPAPAPPFQLVRAGDGYSVHAARGKGPRNPLQRWTVGAGGGACVNELAWSPCGALLAVASQDGVLRVFHYDSMELVGRARSYFGGFLCVCWAPDGRYVVVGGEDDLVTVWALAERRVVARGQGHRSWVSAVAFDPFAGGAPAEPGYRLGSVSQDTQLCLWDLTEDVLRPPLRARASAHLSPGGAGADAAPALSPNGVPGARTPAPAPARGKTNKIGHKHAELAPAEPGARSKPSSVATLSISVGRARDEAPPPAASSLTARLAGFSFGERRSEHRRHFSLSRASAEQKAGGAAVALRGKSAGASGAAGAGAEADALRLMGTAACPRFDECPVLEPLVCKKIAHERLTALLFRQEYFVTACADGCVHTWARPAAPRNSAAAPAPQANGDAGARRLERIDLVD